MNPACGYVTAERIQYIVIGDQNAAFLTIADASDGAAVDIVAQSLIVD